MVLPLRLYIFSSKSPTKLNATEIDKRVCARFSVNQIVYMGGGGMSSFTLTVMLPEPYIYVFKQISDQINST